MWSYIEIARERKRDREKEKEIDIEKRCARFYVFCYNELEGLSYASCQLVIV